ncbi:MAG: rhodanese-like domain-containing protein [Candidatus Paceibacterota bacterium]
MSKAQQASWQKTIDNEIAELWNEYESLYTAESEINVRANSLDRSHETTWSNFLKIVDGQDYLIVDIREGYGYEFGRVTDSIHIRFGDLINGDWQKLLSYKDKPIYIVCYVGSTGALTVNFLESKGFSKLYQPDGGVMKAVKTEKNYPFIGTLDAPGVSGNTNLISEGVFYDSIKDGAKIVDMRAPAHYENNLGLDISYQHFREFMTTKAIKMFVDNLNSNDKYVMLCDSELSCYQGEMLHEDLKRKKIESVGIYQL